jgi:hypothetical protein
MLKYILVVVFGRSSNVCGLPAYQRSGDLSCGQWRLFCFSPVIACLVFVAGVLSMLEMHDGIIRNQLDKCATGCNTQR